MSIKAYTNKNYPSLFDELLVKTDDPNWDHVLLHGFSYDKDHRGYVTKFHMNNILVHAFAGEI